MLHLASFGPGDSLPYLGIIGTWFHCIAFRLAAPGPVNCGSTWASSGRGYSIPSGTDLIVVTLVLTFASSVPCDSGSTWTSPVSGDSDHKHASPDLVTVVSIGTSPGPHVSGPNWDSPGPCISYTPE